MTLFQGTEMDEAMEVDTDPSPNWKPGPEDSSKNTYQFNRFIRMIMACGVSYRQGAKIGNGLIQDLVDIGLLPKDDSLILTMPKIQNEVNRIFKSDSKEHLEKLQQTKIVSIGHDGKASKTLQNHRKMAVESKVTFIENVERGYISHEIPAGPTGEDLANSIYKVSFS